jgi:hypothetical protein
MYELIQPLQHININKQLKTQIINSINLEVSRKFPKWLG